MKTIAPELDHKHIPKILTQAIAFCIDLPTIETGIPDESVTLLTLTFVISIVI